MITIDNKRSIGLEIKTLDNMIARELFKNFDSLGLKLSTIQAGLLVYLGKNQTKEIYQKDLEEKFNIRRSTISGILKTMEKNNLIKRLDSPKDARVKQIILTPTSIKLENYLKQQRIKFDEKLENNISQNDLQIFYKVIDQIKKNIS